MALADKELKVDEQMVKFLFLNIEMVKQSFVELEFSHKVACFHNFLRYLL